MKRVPCDVETFSEADLRKVGGARYAEHPSTLMLMVSWGIDGEVFTWDESQPDESNLELFQSVATDPQYRLMAWNARFEWAIFKHCLGLELPWSRLCCDMVAAMSLSLPAALGDCGPALGFKPEEVKNKDGSRLIQKFSKPRKPTKNKPWTRNTHETDPEDWQAFVNYNRQDVVAEARIFSRIKRWVEQ
jgi:DNA polymerase